MKINYMIRYSWHTLVNRQDRLFTLLNILAVTATMAILVGLSGLLVSFHNYTEAVLQKMPLCIEIFKSKDSLIKDLQEVESEIQKLPGYENLYKIVPTNLAFLSKNGFPCNVRGCTLSPQENIILHDIENQSVQFLSKEALSQPFDEIGLIVSFDFLRRLGYIAENAYYERPETWQKELLPHNIFVQMIAKNSMGVVSNVIVPIPIVAIVPNLPRAEYMITEDFYNITLHWQHEFQYMLKDRHNQLLVTPKPEILQAYWTLTDDELSWLEENEDILSLYQQALQIKLTLEFVEVEDDYEQRLIATPLFIGTKLNTEQLNNLHSMLQKNEELQNIEQYNTVSHTIESQSWSDFPPITHKHQYIQAALYMKDRNNIIPALDELRTIGLFASSTIEKYITTFNNQEAFFKTATFVIFSLILFLSSIVLFSTFYSSLLRKRHEIGIFKAYGASNFLVFILLYIQSTMIIITGCILGIYSGCKMGQFLSARINAFSNLAEGGLIFLLPQQYILQLIGILIATCWIAIFIPSRIAMSIDPAEVVRAS